MSNNQKDDVIQGEIRDLKEPKGRLQDVLEYIDTLPMHLPKPIVERVARLAFVAAYTQVTEHLSEYYTIVLDDQRDGVEEIKASSERVGAFLKDTIQEELRKCNREEPDGS